MHEEFESVIIQLKSNLKNSLIIDTLKLEDDKELHKELLSVLDRYIENINLFDEQKNFIKNLLLTNAKNLLNTINNPDIFYNYLSDFRNNGNFLVDTYYKYVNNHITNNNDDKNINEIRATLSNNDMLIDLEKLKNIDLNEYKNSLNILKETDLNKLNESINKLKEYDLQELYNNLKNKKNILDPNIFQALEKIKNLDLKDYQNKLSQIKNINFEKELNNLENLQKIRNDGFNIDDNSLIGDDIMIGDTLESKENNIGKNITDKIFDKYTNPVLNIKSVSKVFSKYIIKYNAEYTSTIIGIFAKWGRGKTFFYTQLKKDIKKENPNIYFCKFQPWKYQQQESAWAYLYEKILHNYIKNKKTPCIEKISSFESSFRNKFNKQYLVNKLINLFCDFIEPTKSWKIFLLNKTRLGMSKLLIGLLSILCLFIWIILPIDWKFHAVAWVFGVLGLTGTILVYKSYSFYMKSKGTVSDLISHYGKTNDYSNYLGFQNEIEKELKYLIHTYITKDDERLILFIDDLDRCDEKMIINIMDNLRLVLEDNEINKKLTIITAIDERILLKSIKYKYFNKNNNSRYSKIKAKEYIEKFFLVALKLNHLSDKDKIEIVNEYSSIFNSNKKPHTSSIIEINEEVNHNDALDNNIDIKEESITEEIKNISHNEDEELEVINYNEIEFIKDLIIKYNIDTPRKINIMIQRYLLFKNFIFEELGYENTNYQLYISLIFFVLKEKNLKKLVQLYNNSTDNIIEIEINEKKFKENRDNFIILVKYAEMVSPF
ncbi:P-loop NTPase fold protein [Aliarcobacter lanthieri]|uniref:P-loop NTPase fold protein n=1 Tax=Aliarcobacter lanthieri TaxID=1355374 RepID=UPI003AB02C4D